MNPGHDWTRLQQVADHRMARRTLRGVAIGSLVVGGLVLALGLLPPVDPLSAALGAILLATGSWNLIRPKPAGIVIDGITLCLIGAWNISSAFLGEGGAGFWVKLGVFQVFWGGQEMLKFGKFREALAFEPQDTELRAMDESIRSLLKTRPKKDADVFEFVTTGLHAKAWRGRLMDDGALLVKVGSDEAVLIRRHELEIQPGKKVMFGKDLNATFAILGATHKGAISSLSLERFHAWKYGVEVPAAIAA